MIHIAILNKQWDLMPKILSGKKTVESRWYKNKIIPWDKVKQGDIIYFKDSGEKVSLKAKVTKVEQYKIRNKTYALEIMGKYALQASGKAKIPKIVKDYISNKNYGIFVHFDHVEKVEPFNINKAGFGAQAAWLITDDINKLKKA
jgi:ASC-1-like (ASCH) protein